jgi:hypothetical protein
MDISSALTASKAAVRFDDVFMFVPPREPIKVAEADVAGMLDAVRDLAHTPSL